MPEEPSETKRRGLMERIVDLFMHEGISHQTMEGIADNVGVSKRTLYKYFPNKEILIDLAIQYKLESIEAQIVKMLSSGTPILERLTGFFTIIEKALKPMQNKLMMDISRNAPWIWPKIDEFRHNRILNHLGALLKEGYEQGYLRSDLNLDAISLIYMAIIEQVGRPEIMSKLNIPPSQMVETVIGVVFQGILSDMGRREFEEGTMKGSSHD